MSSVSYGRCFGLLLLAAVAGAQHLQLGAGNFTTYQLNVPNSNKSITIIEASTADGAASDSTLRPVTISAERAQQLRDRHYKQQRLMEQEREHQYPGQNRRPPVGDIGDRQSDEDHHNYDRRASAAKVNHQQQPDIRREQPQRFVPDEDDFAADAVSRSPAAAGGGGGHMAAQHSQQQHRYHYPATGSSSRSPSLPPTDRYQRLGEEASRFGQHDDNRNGDVRATIALNVYDRHHHNGADDGDDDEFIQPHSATVAGTFIKKRKVVAARPTTSESATDHYERSPLIDRHQNTTSKNAATYSPLLLQKFIKAYTEKLHLTAELGGQTVKTAVNADAALDRRYDDWTDQASAGSQQSAMERPSPNPFNDKKGWVTLEAVPWSSSKVSKWHAHVDKYDDQQPQVQAVDRPGRPQYDDSLDDDLGYGGGGGRPLFGQTTSVRPAIYTTYQSGGGGGGTGYRPSSLAPSRRPTKYTSSAGSSASSGYGYDQLDRPQYGGQQRPTSSDYFNAPEVEDNFHHHSTRDKWYDQHHQLQSQYQAQSQSQSQRPFSGDIITDHRPYANDFPSSSHRPAAHRPSQPPASTYNYNVHDRFDNSHHPDSGHGEWVLISAQKGYQLPPARHGQRAIHLRPAMGSANELGGSEGRPPPPPPPPAMPAAGGISDLVQHHSVRLTVLPPLDNGTFSSDRRRPQMVLSHGGLLEVESSFDTVDNSVADVFSSGGGSGRPTATKPKQKRRVLKGVPVKSKSGAPDATAVIAAVSAGMVPATMAMMMPLLGRRRRREVQRMGGDGDGGAADVGEVAVWDMRRIERALRN